jgi:hypothetical protein
MSKLGDVRLRLDLLGGFGLALDGNPPRPIPISSRKARAVLAYAAMHPKHGVDRDRLASLLWGDRSDALAYQNLRQCLHLLRTELAPLSPGLLVLDGHRVELNTRSLAVDALDSPFPNRPASGRSSALPASIRAHFLPISILRLRHSTTGPRQCGAVSKRQPYAYSRAAFNDMMLRAAA